MRRKKVQDKATNLSIQRQLNASQALAVHGESGFGEYSVQGISMQAEAMCQEKAMDAYAETRALEHMRLPKGSHASLTRLEGKPPLYGGRNAGEGVRVPSFNKRQTIKEWATEDRPRDKMAEKGVAALTEAELLAILLCSGTRRHSAIGLARLLIDRFGGLSKVAQANLEDLLAVEGIGKAKATSILAAFELSRRRQVRDRKVEKYCSPAQAAAYLRAQVADLPYEVFFVMYLNHANALIKAKTISHGGIRQTTVDPMMVFKEAFGLLATRIILCHNHPSGTLTPSEQDIKLTAQFVRIGEVLDVHVLDHLIVSPEGYYSFKESGSMPTLTMQFKEGLLEGTEHIARKPRTVRGRGQCSSM